MTDYIYLDNAATTQMDPRVASAMLPYMDKIYGNPSSLHGPGRLAREAVDTARGRVAALIGATSAEIVFTGSGTEADNMAVLGIFSAFQPSDAHIVVSSIEHPAILEPCRYLQSQGYGVTFAPVGEDGVIDPREVAKCMRTNTRLVSIMAANNVIGTIQPVAELSEVAHLGGALFHTDAVQAVGKAPLDVARQNIDLLSISAHKLHGPKGVGALFVKAGVTLLPVVRGGGQERGLRSATENVAGIVGFGTAADIAQKEMSTEAAELVKLRDKLIEKVTELIPNAYLIGDRYRRLPGHICLGFDGQEGEAIKLLLELDELGIAVSSGSACSAHHQAEPSYVLRAIGFDAVRARGSLRITLGRFNTEAHVDALLKALPGAVASLRSIVSF
jgi:cysteine desulfurase